MSNARVEYDGVAKTLHWIIAVLVTLLATLGGTMEDMPLAEKTETVMGHSGLGTIILVLMLVRLAWRMTHEPPPPVDMPGWQLKASTFVHWAFYGLVLLQPVFGIAQAAFIDYPVLAWMIMVDMAFKFTSGRWVG